MTLDDHAARIRREMARWDRETAIWAMRMDLFGSHAKFEFEKRRRLEASSRPSWETDRDEARRYQEHILSFARGVAFAMWVGRDPEFPSELQREMSSALRSSSDFLLDVCNEARQLYAVWVAAGQVTDEAVINRVVAEMGDVIRDDE